MWAIGTSRNIINIPVYTCHLAYYKIVLLSQCSVRSKSHTVFLISCIIQSQSLTGVVITMIIPIVVVTDNQTLHNNNNNNFQIAVISS